MANRKMVLTGTYSSFNKGDAAMQISTAQSIKKLWPNCDITVSTPFPEYDEDTYSGYKLIKSTRRNLVLGTMQVIRAKTHRLLKKFFGVNADWLLGNEELQAFSEADVIIDLSGDTLTEDYGPHVTYSHFLPILLGLALNKPVFVCAQSIGPFKLTKGFAKYILKQVDAVTAREEITYNYLKDLGIKNVKLVSDMAFLLDPIEADEARKILEKENIKLSDRPTLGVTVSNLVEKRYNSSNETDTTSFTTDMAGFLDKAIDELEINVLFLGHVTGPSNDKDDRLVAGQVMSHMKHAEKHASLLSGNYRPDELKGVIGLCDIFLGSRMHSNIGALSSNVPTAAIGYSHKTQGIMNSFGLGGFVYDIDSLQFDSLADGLQDLLEKNSEIIKKLDNSISEIKKSSMINVDIIDKLANNIHKD